jgi:ATP-binding cassette subfamily C (CFTR/MRP) protein 1
MSSGPVDKELQAPDDLAAAIEPTYSRDDHDPDRTRRRHDDTSDSNIPLDEDYDAKIIDDRDDSASGNDGLRSSVEATRPVGLTATKSYATDTSAVAGRVPVPHKSENRPWYKKLNPLRWGGIPPIPEERIPSRETNAGFFSLLTWAWMTPLMTVSP